MRARFLILAPGGLHRAKLPGVPGLDAFEGKVFHTSRWDYDHTGGSPSDPALDRLRDQRVAIVGTGCTAIQSVPHVGASAKQLYVFQRTPASVGERLNAPTDPEWVASLKPGWQERRRRNFDDTMTFRPVEEVLVRDGWTAQYRHLAELLTELDPPPSKEEVSELVELVDLKSTEEVRKRVDDTVEDPEIREKLKAWYRQFCKRPTFNDEYLPTFNRPNVTLVDTSDTKGIERITKNGIFVGGREYEVDCIIFATGFDLTGTMKQRLGFDLMGEDGRTLNDCWSEEIRTFQGFAIRNFPNQFLVTFGLQTPFSFNVTGVLDDMARHVAYVVQAALERGVRKIQPTRQAEEDWFQLVMAKGVSIFGDAEFAAKCTPSYYNNEGDPKGARVAGVYPGGVNKFNRELAQWRESGDLVGMDMEMEPEGVTR